MNAREPRLDRLKAIALGFVLVWHLHPIYVDGARAVAAVVRYFDFEISLTAVPTFLLVSLLLFYPKAQQGTRALAKRLWRLTQIFLFWTAVQTAFAVAVTREWPRPSWELLRLGGPGVPIIGGSVFYYLFDLIALTAAAFLYAKLREPWRAIAGAVLVAASLAYFEWSLLTRHSIQYWELQNFLLYVPIAFYLSRLIRYRYLFLIAYAGFAAHDLWLGHVEDCVYARGTVVFGALTLYCTLLSTRAHAGRLASAVSAWSLGLYAIHKYWQYALTAFNGRDGGLSILFGYKAKIGAWMLVLFLVPVTFMMHRFWGVSDPQAAQMQMIMFMKNISILGGALLITQFGAGPVSFDARRLR